jgi:hypothetical protein
MEEEEVHSLISWALEHIRCPEWFTHHLGPVSSSLQEEKQGPQTGCIHYNGTSTLWYSNEWYFMVC